MKSINLFLSILFFLTLFSCSEIKKDGAFQPKIIYQTDDLIITQLSEHSYQHTSYFRSEDFGKVDCNGMIIQDENEAVVFDTPADSVSSIELISWVNSKLNKKIVAIIATHFHVDCVGGLIEFHKAKIPSYANFKTIELTKQKGFNIPKNGFKDSLVVNVGSKKVEAKFLGEGHTQDNVVGYFPSEHIMFGGCLIKELGAGKGNLEDANIAQWPKTIEKIKKEFPSVKLIIPGHGKYGNQELLDYTSKLFNTR